MIISGIFIIYGLVKIYSFFWTLWSLDKINIIKPANSLSSKKKLVFILPVFHETEMIEDTINHYIKKINKYKNIELIVVGTKKERDGNNINPTLDLIKNTILSDKVVIIEYPGKKGYMAHQVNYACKYLKKHGYAYSNTRVHIINIDSRLDNNYFKEIFGYINKGIPILLHSAMFTLNFYKIGFLNKGTSIVQSRWTITGEQRRLLLNLYLTNRKLYHIVGHGLIINLGKFSKHKLLPEDTLNEDMHFGYYLSIEGEKVIPLKNYEEADMPSTFIDWRNQAGGRFIGAMDYYKYMNSYLKKFNKKIDIRVMLLTIQGWYNAFKRLIVSYLFWTLIFMMFYINSIQFYLIGILSIIVYITHYRLTIVFLYNRGYIKDKKISYLISSLIIISIRSFTATLSLIKYILHNLGFLHIEKYKSNHA